MNMNCRELQLYDIPETVFLFNVNFRELTVNYRELWPYDMGRTSYPVGVFY